MKKLSVIKQKIESLDEPWCDLEAGTCHDIEDVEDFVKAQFKKAANDLEEKVEVLRTSTEAALEKTLEKAEERATDALGVARADLEAADGVLRDDFEAQDEAIWDYLNGIEEATEEEVLGALVEVPEGMTGIAVGYVMLPENVPTGTLEHYGDGEGGWQLYGDVQVDLVSGDPELWFDKIVAVPKETIYDGNGNEVPYLELFVEDSYGDENDRWLSIGTKYYPSEEEVPVMPELPAGMIFRTYINEE